jgi:hypothetical protein
MKRRFPSLLPSFYPVSFPCDHRASRASEVHLRRCKVAHDAISRADAENHANMKSRLQTITETRFSPASLVPEIRVSPQPFIFGPVDAAR